LQTDNSNRCQLTERLLIHYPVEMEERIECNPEVMLGKPVIRGTRITVEHILESLAAGETVEELLDDYPHLAKQDILAAIGFAARALGSELVYPFDRAS